MLRALGDLLLPRRCGGCLAPVLGDGLWLCPACRAEISTLALPDAGWSRPAPGVLAVAGFAYGGALAAAIRRAKTPGGHGLAPTLAVLLWERFGVGPAELPAVRTWVPSVPARARSRAVELPRVLAGPGARPLLARRGAPPDQAGLAPARRRTAPFGTFVARGAVPPVVALVDDVRTTGATALALAAAGAVRVLVLTLAAGGQREHQDA
ncbi:MAG TPA: hypothetical protein VNU01_09770, partial [Egibacteraceae bacterium]|nr:hypothetical protein [Egibacteraceae bacterium]